MKVTQEKEFTPITITIETVQEAEILMSIVGKICGPSYGKVRSVTGKIFDSLKGFGVIYDSDDVYTTGEITAKK